MLLHIEPLQVLRGYPLSDIAVQHLHKIVIVTQLRQDENDVTALTSGDVTGPQGSQIQFAVGQIFGMGQFLHSASPC